MKEYLTKLGFAGPAAAADGEMYLEALNSFSLYHLTDLVNAHTEQAQRVVGENHLRCLRQDYWKSVLANYVCAQKNYLRLAPSDFRITVTSSPS